MVLNVVAFEPVDSLNIPINFALQKSKAEVEILLVVVVLPITL
jgi:hypothetical protein